MTAKYGFAPKAFKLSPSSIGRNDASTTKDNTLGSCISFHEGVKIVKLSNAVFRDLFFGQDRCTSQTKKMQNECKKVINVFVHYFFIFLSTFP